MKLHELNPQQLANAKLIDSELVAIGLTNKFLRAGILAVCSKESGFKMFAEISYRNTPNERIYQIFGYERFKGYDLSVIKKNDKEFFDLVYNRKDLGNGPFDGYKFRGRGFNQITGRYNYTETGKAIGVDLANNPDLLDQPPIAAKALASFFRRSIVSGQMSGKFLLRYGIVTTSQISTIEKGATIAHQANMGWAKVPSQDPTGAFKITVADAPSYLQLAV